MATQTMGQLYVGNFAGKKWNNAWSQSWQNFAGSLFEFSVDQLPQEPFDDLLSLVFYDVVDNYYNGKVPKQVASCVDVPKRTDKTLQEVLKAAREGVETS